MGAGIGSDDLCMDAETIADILQCQVETWDHANITRLNPGLRCAPKKLQAFGIQRQK